MVGHEEPSPARRIPGLVLLAFITSLPLALALVLLAFGLPDKPVLAPGPRSFFMVGAAAVLLGPIAQLQLGLVRWFAMLGVLVAAVLLVAGVGPPRRRTLQE
jgi:hypothetical protein